ncbi:hypothetical protein G3I19_09795 [Streptomyces sp. SID10853]|nr:hypothetical protein [Streptomyces sp. SID10853]
MRSRARLTVLAADDAVPIADEAGDRKKGTRSAGVRRQHTGTAGRIENSQINVHLSCPSPARAHPDRPGALPGQGLGRYLSPQILKFLVDEHVGPVTSFPDRELCFGGRPYCCTAGPGASAILRRPCIKSSVSGHT